MPGMSQPVAGQLWPSTDELAAIAAAATARAAASLVFVNFAVEIMLRLLLCLWLTRAYCRQTRVPQSIICGRKRGRSADQFW